MRFPVVAATVGIGAAVTVLLALGEDPAAQECKTVAFFDHYAAEPKELVRNRAAPSGATGAVGRGWRIRRGPDHCAHACRR